MDELIADPTTASGSQSPTGSFFSVTSGVSGNTVYYTAQGSLASGMEDVNGTNGSEDCRHQKIDRRSPDEYNSGSSSTLNGADSLRSLSGSDEDSITTTSENGREVKEDVSRLCCEIAESEYENLTKKLEIEQSISKNVRRLRTLARSDGGLLSNSLRYRAWPVLLGIRPEDMHGKTSRKIPKEFPHVPEQIQNLVELDVARVLKRFPPGLSDPQQDHLQTYLTSLICSVLEKCPEAYYYQGFHDISLTFLLVCISQRAPYLAYLCLNRMIEICLGPYMEKSMDSTHDLIHVVFALIEKEDAALYKKIVIDSKCPVAFCLAWVLTWFSHTLPNDTDVFRLYDFVLGCLDRIDPPCLIPVFVSASLVLRNSEKIKTAVRETDIASMHYVLSKLPSELGSLEPWLEDSVQLMDKYSGEESNLMKRAVEIKVMQSQLWNEDTNNNRRRPNPRRNIFVEIGRFLFVRHPIVTMAIVVVGAAFLIQSKLGSRIYGMDMIKSMFEKYTPNSIKKMVNDMVN